ncbi:ATP-dependent DNA helicase RecG [Candidatus Binatia bacterium]|nr:ATP-dependent DNA helicase RecG [Candidatus Binatia bacterium]
MLRPRTDGSGPPDSIERYLAAVAAPLKFLAAAPAAAARTRFPAAALAARGRSLIAAVGDELARAPLTALVDALAAYDTVAAADRTAYARRCVELLAAAHPATAPAPPYRRTAAVSEETLAGLGRAVQFVRGVGPRRAEQFRKVGIATLEDLLYHLPFRYDDRRTLSRVRDLRPGMVASVVGELVQVAERHVGRAQRRILEAVLRDDSGYLGLTWFHQVAYFRSRFRGGQRCLVHGKIEPGVGGVLRMVHPEVEIDPEVEGQGILPVYNKPSSMTVGAMRRLVHDVAGDWIERVPSVLPEAVVRAARVTDLAAALRLVHEPQRDADIEALNGLRTLGHRSLVFDELFFLQLGMALRRRNVEREAGLVLVDRGGLTGQLRAYLPFRLTRAQERVIAEIGADMRRPHPMHRLVQGDVGSGKTVVALFAALVAIDNEYQAAFMAPTELLAEQHFTTVERLVAPLGLRVELLTGARSRAQRRAAYARLADGETQLAVGTHALIQDAVKFKRLGLGVIDEQHRFGVLQRAALCRLGAEGAAAPDILLMTATPIPRTLTMAVYGDLDISLLDEMPPGRQPVRTLLRHEGERARVYDLVKRELDRGRQGYVVYPLVDPSDAVELRDATSMQRELARTVFSGYRVGLVHGRMKAAEKDAVMRRFKDGDVQVLVSTTVVEVGIDVPNATIMVIEHAERFGLAQLHQLRGRVGRGDAAALCVLVTPFRRGQEAHRRLDALVRTTDGFRIAEADLEIRGPGELLGTRQSGLPDFRVANLIRDRGILEAARTAALRWLEDDPKLDSEESQAVRKVLAHRWAGRLELAGIG